MRRTVQGAEKGEVDSQFMLALAYYNAEAFGR